MDIKQIAKETAKVLSSYLTYQAVRTVIDQLSETDPPVAFWLNGFSSTGKIQDGEAYLRELLQERQELAFRIMTVRDHLAQETADMLPEMVRTSIREANVQYRRQHLERMTQLSYPDSSAHPELEISSEPNVDNLST